MDLAKNSSKVSAKEKEITPDVTNRLEPRAIDYVWTMFMFLAFAIIGFWYTLIYFALCQQRDSSRFHYSRFGFQNQEEVAEAFAAYDWPRLTSLWIAFASVKVHQIYYEEGMKYLQPYFVSVSTEKNSGLREAKATKNAQNFSKAVYLTLSSIVCLYYMNQSNYLPMIMGGISSKNNLSNQYANYPLVNHTPGLNQLVLILSGYHFSGTIRHLKTPVEKRRNDHIEMCLHHLLTLSLFYGAYIMNNIEQCIIVSYLMDFCDVPIHFAKALVDTHWKKTCTGFGVIMWLLWGYTRLYCFPIFIYYTYIHDPFQEPHNMAGSYEGYNSLFIASLLSILFIMGIWWWYLISKMVFTALTKGKREDIQNKID